MKILVVHNSYSEPGGEDEVVNSEVRLLESLGHKVILYKRSNKEIADFSFFKKLHILSREIIWSQETYNQIKKLIAEEKPDLAHIHNIYILISPSIYQALDDSGIPIVQTLHNYRLICPGGIFYRSGKICEKCISGKLIYSIIHCCWRGSFWLTLALSKALGSPGRRRTFHDKISTYIVLSEFSKEKFQKAGLPSEKIFVKPNFVDSDNRAQRSSFDNFVLFVGRLSDYKGILTLVEVFKNLPKFRLKIVGDGPLRGKLTQEIAKIVNIDLLGRLSYQDTQASIKRAVFVVFPSECYESTPRVVIESLSYGVPVLVSDIGFKGGDVEKEGIGLKFEHGNSNDLMLKVKQLMGNREQLKEMGKAAFKVYKEKYTPQRDYELLMDIYEKAIATNK